MNEPIKLDSPTWRNLRIAARTGRNDQIQRAKNAIKRWLTQANEIESSPFGPNAQVNVHSNTELVYAAGSEVDGSLR